MSEHVLQRWLLDCPIRMQSTLILGLRGPDTHACPNVKAIGRWMRGLAFRPGNPDNVLEFMRVEEPTRIWEKGPAAKELEFCSWHYVSHLLHALEVIGYRHPSATVAGWALGLCGDLCALMHLPMESREGFEERLCTRDWPGGVAPDTAEEAAALLNRSAP